MATQLSGQHIDCVLNYPKFSFSNTNSWWSLLWRWSEGESHVTEGIEIAVVSVKTV